MSHGNEKKHLSDVYRVYLFAVHVEPTESTTRLPARNRFQPDYFHYHYMRWECVCVRVTCPANIPQYALLWLCIKSAPFISISSVENERIRQKLAQNRHNGNIVLSVQAHSHWILCARGVLATASLFPFFHFAICAVWLAHNESIYLGRVDQRDMWTSMAPEHK